jgi:hypothetical protein
MKPTGFLGDFRFPKAKCWCGNCKHFDWKTANMIKPFYFTNKCKIENWYVRTDKLACGQWRRGLGVLVPRKEGDGNG